jgi:tyrosine phenol-lyase
MKTIIEPFKIKMVERLRMTTREDRQRIIESLDYNPFLIRSKDVLIDFLTDSGTSSMSDQQWAALISGDEAYAGSSSYFKFEEKIQEITGYKHVIPTHQGRAAERILFAVTTKAGDIIPNNTHFDTTRANIEFTRAKAVDLMDEACTDPETIAPFKGNIDLDKLAALLDAVGPEGIPLGMITVTNNASGGQPVSMANIKATAELLRAKGIPFIIDACRFAENAYFIKTREAGYEDKSLLEIAREMFSYADGCTMSAKKDAFANIGGFLAINNDDWAERARTLLVLTEGFPTYGGLAGRDLAAIAQGLDEILDLDYMQYRIRSTQYLGENLEKVGVPIYKPTGGHAIYINARKFLPHIPPEEFPGQALVVEMYVEGGIRAVEIGSVMFGKNDPETGAFVPAKNELVRMAIPRRVYTQSHVDYVIEAMADLAARKDTIRGLKFKWEAPILRHFTSTFQRV